MKTPLQLHIEKWKDGCGSPYCGRAQRVCHVRGSLPADVAFIGEAPGDSEDVCGQPFTGPAGAHLQKYVIRAAIPHEQVSGPDGKPKWVPTGIKYALFNLTGCIPLDEHHVKTGPPDPEEIQRCAPRLLELLHLCKPKLIVCVGKEAEVALDPWMKDSVLNASPLGEYYKRTPRISILHPAYILRQHLTNQGLQFQRAALAVEQAIDDYVINGHEWYGGAPPAKTKRKPGKGLAKPKQPSDNTSQSADPYADDPDNPIPF